MKKFKHIFGPVPSRRLGLSLGVDIVPLKTCTLSCLYCQVGKTPVQTIDRMEYVKTDDILSELRDYFSTHTKPDWVTFSGSGEPTLNSGIGEIIDGVKEITDTPVCVITNGTLLWMPEVRKDILKADAVMPSLDAALEPSFTKICQPHPELNIGRILDGLVAFRNEYSGKIWLEILFVNGINDTEEDIDALVSAAQKISPDSIQLNTVVRPPAETSAGPLDFKRLDSIREKFGEKAEIIASFKNKQNIDRMTTADEIREYLKRRPGTLEDLELSLHSGKKEILDKLSVLKNNGEIKENQYFGKVFWEFVPENTK